MRPAQSTVEYGLLIAAVAVIVLLGASSYGTAIQAWFGQLVFAVTH